MTKVLEKHFLITRYQSVFFKMILVSEQELFNHLCMSLY